MNIKNTEELFEILEVIQRQTAEKEVITATMLDILSKEGFEDDDIPQNSNVGISMKALIKEEKDLFSAIQQLDVEFVKVGEYICFKVDDNTSGTEDIFFISSTEVLYLESGCLSIF